MDKQINRFKQREQAFFLIFQAQFRPVEDDDIAIYSENVEEVGDYAKELFAGVLDKESELDEIISQYSNGWKLSRIPKVNISILRLAVYEMKYIESVPNSVAIRRWSLPKSIRVRRTHRLSTASSALIQGVTADVCRF